MSLFMGTNHSEAIFRFFLTREGTKTDWSDYPKYEGPPFELSGKRLVFDSYNPQGDTMESPASHYLKSPQLWVKHPNGEYSILPNVHHTIPVIDHVDWRSSKRVPVLYELEPCTGFKVHSIPDTCALISYACNILGFGLYRDGDKLDHDAFCASLMNEYLSKGDSEDENHLPLV